MTGQIQKNLTDCGVACLSYATGRAYNECAKILGYQGRENFRDNIGSDTHWNHYAVLTEAMQIVSGISGLWRKVSADDILSGQCAPEKTVVCLWLTLTNFHWVVMAEFIPITKQVRCYMGNGKVGIFTEDQLRSQFWAAYEIGKSGETESLVDVVMSKILRLVA